MNEQNFTQREIEQIDEEKIRSMTEELPDDYFEDEDAERDLEDDDELK